MPVFLSREEIEQHGKEIADQRKELFKRRYLPEAGAFPDVRALMEPVRVAGQHAWSLRWNI